MPITECQANSQKLKREKEENDNELCSRKYSYYGKAGFSLIFMAGGQAQLINLSCLDSGFKWPFSHKREMICPHGLSVDNPS